MCTSEMPASYAPNPKAVGCVLAVI